MPKVNLMRVFGVICAAALVLVTAVSYISWQVNDIEDSVLRLHIVANSDSDEDQALKLKVRDEVVDRCGFLFENCVSAEQSIKTAADNIGFIKYVAEQVITENGYNYDADCQVTQCSFPTGRGLRSAWKAGRPHRRRRAGRSHWSRGGSSWNGSLHGKVLL